MSACRRWLFCLIKSVALQPTVLIRSRINLTNIFSSILSLDVPYLCYVSYEMNVIYVIYK